MCVCERERESVCVCVCVCVCVFERERNHELSDELSGTHGSTWTCYIRQRRKARDNLGQRVGGGGGGGGCSMLPSGQQLYHCQTNTGLIRGAAETL